MEAVGKKIQKKLGGKLFLWLLSLAKEKITRYEEEAQTASLHLRVIALFACSPKPLDAGGVGVLGVKSGVKGFTPARTIWHKLYSG